MVATLAVRRPSWIVMLVAALVTVVALTVVPARTADSAPAPVAHSSLTYAQSIPSIPAFSTPTLPAPTCQVLRTFLPRRVFRFLVLLGVLGCASQ